jgi:antitoxin (DNA-binding transcriptional repressor) of toxin-antitoxin stability system
LGCFIQITEIYEMESFMESLTSAEVQTNFDQALDFVKAGKELAITEDGQPTAMLFSFKEGSELLRLRDAARLDGYLAARSENAAQGVPELSMDDINKLVNELRL